MFADFGCFKDYDQTEIIEAIYNKKDDNRTQILNGLAWFIAEEIARTVYDIQESE